MTSQLAGSRVSGVVLDVATCIARIRGGGANAWGPAPAPAPGPWTQPCWYDTRMDMIRTCASDVEVGYDRVRLFFLFLFFLCFLFLFLFFLFVWCFLCFLFFLFLVLVLFVLLVLLGLLLVLLLRLLTRSDGRSASAGCAGGWSAARVLP